MNPRRTDSSSRQSGPARQLGEPSPPGLTASLSQTRVYIVKEELASNLHMCAVIGVYHSPTHTPRKGHWGLGFEWGSFVFQESSILKELIPALGKQRQEDHKFRAILGWVYLVVVVVVGFFVWFWFLLCFGFCQSGLEVLERLLSD